MAKFITAFCFLLSASSVLSATPHAFITNQLDNSVSVIDTEQRKVIETLKVTGKPA
ncbi:MAG: hypothetical protein RL563_818, partial [Pseudomonadota bacterium]